MYTNFGQTFIQIRDLIIQMLCFTNIYCFILDKLLLQHEPHNSTTMSSTADIQTL